MLTRTRNAIYDAAHLAPSRLAIPSGLRAAIATVVPLVVGFAFGISYASWAALGGFLTALVDKGGDYRTRAASAFTLAAVCAITAIIGGWLAALLVTAVIGMFIWATVGSMLRVLGATATTIGIAACIVFADSLAVPASSWPDAFSRGAALFAGGIWSMVLSLLLWPIQYYRPARRAVAHVYEVLEDHASAIIKFSAKEGSHLERQHVFLNNPAAIRDAIEHARETLTGTRRGRAGETPRGERLLVALEAADQAFAILMAIADQLDVMRRDVSSNDVGGLEEADRALARTLENYRKTLSQIVTLIQAEQGEPLPPDITWGGEAIRSALAKVTAANYASDLSVARYEHIALLLAQLREYTHIVAANVAALNTARRVNEPDIPRTFASPLIPEPTWQDVLRDALSTDAIAFPHALRMGVTTAFAVLVTSLLNLEHAYWVTLTVIIILQPYLSATMLKGLQRVGGTLLGGVAAALIASLFNHPYAMLASIFVLATVGISMMAVNYGLYSAFIACTFILLSEVNAPDKHLVEVRILNTILGGVLALISAYLLWPRRERTIFPQQMAEALRASQHHVQAVMARVLKSAPGAEEQYVQARRVLGLAIINAEASFQRLLAESGKATQTMESAMALITYIRRFNTAVTGFGSVPWDQAPQPWRELLSQGEPIVEEVLLSLADSMDNQQTPVHFPHFPVIDGNWPSTEGIPQLVYRMQLERVTRQLRVLHSAVVRYTTPSMSIAFTSEMILPAPYGPRISAKS